MNSLIFGKDQTEGIVNITLKNNQVYLYKDVNGKIELEQFEYAPWVLTKSKVRPHSERLKGDQYWRYLTSTTCEKFEALQGKWIKDLWIPRSIEECFTLCEGVTYYKNRKVNDISILSFDIEGDGLVMDETSKVYIISNTLRKNGMVTKKLFALDDYASDREMIAAWCDWVRGADPSIVCGHNIFGYDLPYLRHCYRDGLKLGRDGSAMTFESRTSRYRKDASQQYDYHNAHITGREIVDTFFLSMKYDQATREFPSYGLKPIVKHLGLEKTDRAFIDASKMGEYYEKRQSDPQTWQVAKDYSLDDSEDALKLYNLMIPAYFYLAQSVPKTLQQMVNEATGSQIDALMIRSYLQNGYSQPRTSGKVDFEGAISMGIPGNYKYVCKADVASLYPSIMLHYNIHDPKKDPENHLIKMLTYFRDERLRNKKLAKDTGDKFYDDMQGAQKIMINSAYGFCGAGYLLYNYPEGAAEVTRKGREVLLQGVQWATGYTLEKVLKAIKNEGTEDAEEKYEWKLGARVSEGLGYTLVNVDTDSFSITNNAPVTDEMFTAKLAELNSLYPKLIRWEHDGIYEKVIVIRAKNYVLVRKGKVKIKGSAITDPKKEPALTEMLGCAVRAILDDKTDDIPNIYEAFVKEAASIQDINRWATKKTVTKSVLNAKRANEQKPLDAINECIDAGIIEKVSEGDKVWLYNAIRGEVQEVKKGEPVFYKDGRPKLIPNRILKDVRLYEHDQDVLHYLERCYDTISILGNVIDMDKIVKFHGKKNRHLLKNLTITTPCATLETNAQSA
jgi:DNA polymerase elongation subunit (family B)